jgi:hypothetical protein
VAVVLCAASPARADLITLMQDVPDIFACNSTIRAMYNATSGTTLITVKGMAVSYDLHNLATPDYAITSAFGDYCITATVNSSGQLQPGGTILIKGMIDSPTLHVWDIDPVTHQRIKTTLLKGDLTDFGYDPSGGESFQFLFTVTGGALRDAYGGVGSKAGVLYESGLNSFTGSFNKKWGNAGQDGTADNFPTEMRPVPLPAVLPAGMVLLLAIGSHRKLRQAA